MKNNLRNTEYLIISSDEKFFKHWFVYFMIWPFGTLIQGLKNFSHFRAKSIFWLFCIYFGFVFVYDNPFVGGGGDSARYAGKLILAYNNPLSFDILLSLLYDPAEQYVDIYEPILIWFVAIFTDNPRFLFMVFAVIFGYFYTQNLWIILEKVSEKIFLLIFLFIMAYALVNPIWNINGVRFYTAAQIFLFGNLRYFLLNDKKGIIWSISAFLIHFSFLFPVTVFLVYLFIPYKSLNILFAFYIFTAFFGEVDIINFKSLLSYLPDVFQPKVTAYTYEERVFRLGMGGRSLHVVFALRAFRWIIYFWIIALFVNRKYWTKQYPDFKKLFLFALLFGSFANLASNVPSGSRFHVLSDGLFLIAIIYVISQIEFKTFLNLLKVFTIPLLAFTILFNIRIGLDYIGLFTFFGNPIIAFFIELRTPLIDYVKMIFG